MAAKSQMNQFKTLDQLKQIHSRLLKSTLPENPYAIAPILAAAATSGDDSFFSYACSIFNNLSHRNTFMYNSMIRGYVQSGSPVPAIFCYLDMIHHGLVANNYTFPPLIKACTLISRELKLIGYLVHAHVIKFGCRCDPFVVSSLVEFYSLVHIETARLLFDKSSNKDVVVWTTMIDGYGKMGDVENARELFNEMPERNVIAWSAIIAAYSQSSDFKEVICLFGQMQEKCMKPNDSVLVSVLTACAHLGAITQGLWIHSYAKRCNLDSNPILATSLVDMYAKCGCIESAISVFEGIRSKDAGAWNAIISGVAINGDVKKSLELFKNMVLSGTSATTTTFVALLTACTHAKMVDEGVKLFEQMYNLYGVEPQPEHYACVVNLIARAGMIEEAEKFIEHKMGGLGRVDANVYGALLSGCRIYSNVEIGNRVWKKLSEMSVTDCGVHVLSYNIYSEAGWEMEAKTVRRDITKAGMIKEPGCSVIEVDGAVQVFFAGDLRHPQSLNLRKMLETLLKMADSDEFLVKRQGWAKLNGI